MKPSVLFIVTSDPRVSHRPAEAIRIAAGVGAWQRVEPRVYLRDAAVLALEESTDRLIDEDHFRQYLPILVEAGQPIYAQEDAPGLPAAGAASAKFEPISDSRLAALAAESRYVLRF